MPEQFADPHYLRTQQYRDPSNLLARACLHERFSVPPSRWFDWVHQSLPIHPGDSILEVGCGNGALWLSNNASLPEGATLTLSDLSTGMLSRCREGLGEGGARCLCLNAQSIPFPMASFDLVIANHMLYHVPDLAHALSELSRVLNPGGTICAATNGQAHLAELHALIRSVIPAHSLQDPSTRRFSLERAPHSLAPFFSDIETLIYPNHLWVTETQPLVDYIASLSGLERSFSQDELAELGEKIEAEIRRKGGFFIQKSTGMIRARKPSTPQVS